MALLAKHTPKYSKYKALRMAPIKGLRVWVSPYSLLCSHCKLITFSLVVGTKIYKKQYKLAARVGGVMKI